MLASFSFKRFRLLGAVSLASIVGGCVSLDTSAGGVASLVIISGNQQTVRVGANSAAPLVVRAYDENASAMPDVDIEWSVLNNGGSVSAGATTTDDTGTAQVSYTAPSTPGNAQVTATTEGLTVTFNLTIVAASGN